MRGVLALIIMAYATVRAGAEEKRSWVDLAGELVSRHPAWFDYGEISPQFVVLVPLDEGVKMSRVEEGPKRIGRDPEISLYGTSSNRLHTLQGELRVMKKDGEHDVLEAFKKLKVQEVGETETSEAMIAGDRIEGQYALVYKMRDGSVTNEKILNLYNDFAVSYKITAKPGGKEEEQAQNMVADYFVMRKCSRNGDSPCVSEKGR